jgi:hypothetical protein
MSNLMATPWVKQTWSRALGGSSWAKRYGSFREQESFGLVDRCQYCYGMLRAADVAKFFGHKRVTVCEFGVATGNGLLNMVKLAELITEETGVEFRVVGFDTGAGLPEVHGYKDHPELWSSGDFATGDVEGLRRKLNGRAELVIGDIHDTVEPFLRTLMAHAPLGFVSIDVDIYSGTVSSLKVLGGSYVQYLPAISVYLDDVNSFFSSPACGELCAVDEHNTANPLRPIHHDRSLLATRPSGLQPWYEHMYVAHVLDHLHRNRPRNRDALSLDAHRSFMQALR